MVRRVMSMPSRIKGTENSLGCRDLLEKKNLKMNKNMSMNMKPFLQASLAFMFILSATAMALWYYHNERLMVVLFLVKNPYSVVTNSSDSVSEAPLQQPRSFLQKNTSFLVASNDSSSETDKMVSDEEQRKEKENEASSVRKKAKEEDGTEDSSAIKTKAEENAEGNSAEEEEEECDIFRGKWVYDESYVLHPPGDCPFSSRDFRCRNNGREELKYEHWRWQPDQCDLPRFNASELLQKLRGKRLVFVGDSIARNQWESMLCILRGQVPAEGAKMTKSYSGRSLAYVLQSCNCSVELSWAPFIVQQRSFTESNQTRETLQIDTIDEKAQGWKNADILVFNSGHWWVHPEPLSGENYFEEGGIIHPHMDEPTAFRKALRTWTNWLDKNVNPNKTQVFFRTYSPTHFNGNMWGKKVGGGCFNETDPIDKLDEEEGKRNQEMQRGWSVAKAIEETKSIKIKLLNITWMSLHRKDAHNSVYRADMEVRTDYRQADCSHWCIPGLPDVWNHLLFALISSK